MQCSIKTCCGHPLACINELSLLKATHGHIFRHLGIAMADSLRAVGSVGLCLFGAVNSLACSREAVRFSGMQIDMPEGTMAEGGSGLACVLCT